MGNLGWEKPVSQVITNLGDAPTSNARVGKCQLSSLPQKKSGSMSLKSTFVPANYVEKAEKSNYKNNRSVFCFC